MAQTTFGRGRGILLAGKFKSTYHFITFNQCSRVSRVTSNSTYTCVAVRFMWIVCRINNNYKNCNMLKKIC